MSASKESHIIQTIKEYGRSLLSFIRSRVKSDADAEDILQDVWYQFSAVINAEPIEQTGAWLFKVARNKITDRHKKKKEEPLPETVSDDDEEIGAIRELMIIEKNTPETEYLRTIFWQQFFEALGELPEAQRQVFLWHEIDGLSFNQIAGITGENTGTLISRKRYAVLHLRSRLKVLRDEILNY